MVTIQEIGRFRLESQGNGAFLLLSDRTTGESVFFQGDCAALFLSDYEAADALESPELATRAKLALFEAYSDFMEPSATEDKRRAYG
jgi:hypothetical protein